MKEIALDLRNNPGGRLDVAKILPMGFLKKGNSLPLPKKKNGNIQYYYASGNGRFKKGKLYILINEKSASSSEILAVPFRIIKEVLS